MPTIADRIRYVVLEVVNNYIAVNERWIRDEHWLTSYYGNHKWIKLI